MSSASIKNEKLGLIALAFMVAFFSSGIGIGGGCIFISTLMAVFKFSFDRAAGISLATIAPITLVGTIGHFVFNPKLPTISNYYMVFIPMCVLGTLIAAKFLKKQKGKYLKLIFSCFLFIVGLKMLKLVDLPKLFLLGTNGYEISHELGFVSVFGLIIGFTATFLGVGCGLAIVPFFVILLKVDMHEAVRLSLTTMFFLACSGTMIRKKLEILDTNSQHVMLLPAIIGSIVGAAVSNYLPGYVLKKIFGCFVLSMAFKFTKDSVNEIRRGEENENLQPVKERVKS